jgi:hypothetical protein
VLNKSGDLKTPSQLHPVFFGSFDWHSCVHGYWLLATLLRLFPEMRETAKIEGLFDHQLTPEKIRAEVKIPWTTLRDVRAAIWVGVVAHVVGRLSGIRAARRTVGERWHRSRPRSVSASSISFPGQHTQRGSVRTSTARLPSPWPSNTRKSRATTNFGRL